MDRVNPLKRRYEWLGEQLCATLSYLTQHQTPIATDMDRESSEDRFNPRLKRLAFAARAEDDGLYSLTSNQIAGAIARDVINGSGEMTYTEKSGTSHKHSPKVTGTPQSQPTFTAKGVQVVTVNEEEAQVYALLITPELLGRLKQNMMTLGDVGYLDKRVCSLVDAIDSAQEDLDEVQECYAQLLTVEQKLGRDGMKSGSREAQALLQQEQSLQEFIAETQRELFAVQQQLCLTNSAKEAHEKAFYDLLGPSLNESGLLTEKQVPRITSSGDSVPDQLVDNSLEDHTTDLKLPSQSSEPSETPSEAKRLYLRVRIEEKRNKAAEYRHALDDFSEIFERNMAQLRENAMDEDRDSSAEFFDYWHSEQKAFITEGLINTENELRVLKAEALEAGIKPAFDEGLMFQDGPKDGCAENLRQDMIDSVPSAKIQSWLNEIPKEAFEITAVDSEPLVECDELDTKPIEIGDSVSCIRG